MQEKAGFSVFFCYLNILKKENVYKNKMKNNFYIKQLFHARKLNSDKDYHIFENAVKNLYDKITIQDIYKICNIFCDNTNDHEFMFQLVHLIEQIKGKCYLYCIARCSPDMTEANE